MTRRRLILIAIVFATIAWVFHSFVFWIGIVAGYSVGLGETGALTEANLPKAYLIFFECFFAMLLYTIVNYWPVYIGIGGIFALGSKLVWNPNVALPAAHSSAASNSADKLKDD